MSCGILSRIFTTERVPDMLVEFTMNLTDNRIIMLLINLVMIVLGMLMDDGSAIVLSTPLLLSIATSIGVDSVHYAAIMGVVWARIWSPRPAVQCSIWAHRSPSNIFSLHGCPT